MSGGALLIALAGLVPALVLVVSAASHLAHVGELAADLRRQAVLGDRAVAVATVALPLTEAVVGVGAAAAILGWPRSTTSPLPHVAVLVLYAAFGAYAMALLARPDRDEVPCGCAPTAAAVSTVVPLRAAVLAGLALVAALTTPSLAGLGGAATVVTWLAAATFTIAAWALPSALATHVVDRATAKGPHVVHG